MNNGRLILHPAPPTAIPASNAELIKELRDIGFVSSAWEATPDKRYLAGARFLQLVTFLGCSPYVPLQPPADGSLNFCHVSLSGPWNSVRFIAGSTSASPRCPDCRRKNPAWKQMIEAWQKDRASYRWTCPACGATSEVASLNWRQGAGFGRFFLEIQNIFPGEAVPGDELLRTLAASTDTPWIYFYATG